MKFNFTNVPLFQKRGLLKLIMRTFIFICCTISFSFNTKSVHSQDAPILIESDRTVTVKQVFDLIKKQTDYKFIYRSDLLENVAPVALKKGTIKVDELLNKCLSPANFTYSFKKNNTVVVKRKMKQAAKVVVVKGVVVDENGEPLPGANVIIKGTTTGTVTDHLGKFSLSVPDDAILIVSYLGYDDREVAVNGRSVIDVQLQTSLNSLSGVVVIGYGTQKKNEVTGAISSVQARDISNNGIGNQSFDRALSGLIKGVNVVQNDGRPGGGVDINIRGITSPFASGSDNNPLFVIDGVPFQTNPAFAVDGALRFAEAENPLLALNPNDIESIDVLKDASATAIYGSRGANGVIIVTTKTGEKEQNAQVTLSAISTFSEPINTLDYLNTNEWKNFIDGYFQNSVDFSNQNPAALSEFSFDGFNHIINLSGGGGTPLVYNGLNEDFFGIENTNWANEVYRNSALTQQYNLSIAGGGTHSTYNLSVGYTNQEGLLLKDKFKQYNLRLGLHNDINKTFNVGIISNIGYSNNKSGFGRNDLNRVLNARPDIAARDADGNFVQYEGVAQFGGGFANYANPLAETTGNTIENKALTLLGNVYAEARIFKNFKLRYDFNVSRFGTDGNTFSPTLIVRGTPLSAFGGPSAGSSLTVSDVVNTNVISNVTANYSTTINKHTLSGLLGFAWDRNTTNREYFVFVGFPDDEVLNNITNAGNTQTSEEATIETGLNSIFARLGYNYNRKYFLTANFRTDKSSRFGPNNRRAYFPSVSASWDIASEGFLAGIETITDLRFRIGIGRTGSNNIADFQFLQFFNVPIGADRLYNGGQTVGLTGTLPNKDIKWEITDEINVGLNFGLFNDRLRGSIDVYSRKTKGALIPGFFPLETGASQFVANLADLSNEGVEIDLGGDIIRSDNFKWSANFNISRNNNILDEFVSDFLNTNVIDNYEEGKEVNLIKGYVVETIFQTQDEVNALNAAAPDGFYQEFGTAVGDYKFVDLNGDGEITVDDREVLGSSQADFFGGFNTSLAYRGFELSAFFNYSVGGEALDIGQLNALDIGARPIRNVAIGSTDRWTPGNTDAPLPRAILEDPNNNFRTSDRLIHKTSYLRLKNIRLSYSLPQSVLGSVGLSGTNIFVAGSNLWTLTDFPGVDPEGIGNASATNSTLSQTFYPIAKSWSVGVNVKF